MGAGYSAIHTYLSENTIIRRDNTIRAAPVSLAGLWASHFRGAIIHRLVPGWLAVVYHSGQLSHQLVATSTRSSILHTMMNETVNEMSEMILIGYFAIGNGKFGEYAYGKAFEPVEGNTEYWENRGYDLVPVYVLKAED